MTHLALSLLGPPQILYGGAPLTTLESKKVRALLAYLAVESDRPLPRAGLVGLLWPDLPDQAARHNLRQALTNLRQVLGSLAAEHLLIITRDTIQLNPAGDSWVDVAAFSQLLAACAAHRHRRLEACADCAARLSQAADLYRGEFLAHFFLDDSAAFDEWAALTRTALQQQAIRALGQLAAYHERRGAYAEVQQALTRQLAIESWREESHRALMRTLARSGQRCAALAQFERCQAILSAELGVTPEPATVALYHSIRGSTTQELADQPQRRQARLPLSAEPFIDRPIEQARLAEYLASPAHRLITLVGPGGIGKTRLGLQVASEHALDFDDGACFVSLESLASVALIPSAIATALGVPPEHPDALQHIQLHLQHKDLLLLLDNFEHLMAGAGLISTLIQATNRLTLLVTSRERLHLQGEWVVPVGSMPVALAESNQEPADGAIALFLAYARRADPAFVADPAALATIGQICRLVGGVPLAIELAAAWVRVLPCAEIARELERGLGVLTTALRDGSERHRSMRAVFDHSWRLLSGPERTALRRLAIFQGGWLRDVAARVAGADVSILAALLDKSLIRRSPAGRYAMHELVQQYAYERLEAAGELMIMRSAHRDSMLALAEQAEPALVGSDQSTWLDRLEAEHDNLRVALHWTFEQQEHAIALRLCMALWKFWHIRGHQAEGYRWFTAALEVNRDLEAAARAGALYGAGWLAYDQGMLEQARHYFESSLELYREIGDLRGMGRTLHGVGEMIARDPGTSKHARSCFEASLELFRSLGDDEEVAWSLDHIGRAASMGGDLTGACVVLEQGLALFRKLGHSWGIEVTLYNLGDTLLHQGRLPQAAAMFEECIALSRTIGSDRNTMGIFATARLGETCLYQGDLALAQALLEKSLRLSQEIGASWNVALVLRDLGLLAQIEGDYRQSRLHLHEGLLLLRLEHQTMIFVSIVDAWADLALREGDPMRAAVLYGAAAVLRERYQVPILPLYQALQQRNLAALKAELEPARFEHAWAEGGMLSCEQILQLCPP